MKKITITTAIVAAVALNVAGCALEPIDLLKANGNKNATDWKKSVYDTDGRDGGEK